MSEILMCEFLKHLTRNNACKTAMILQAPWETGERNHLELSPSLILPKKKPFLHYAVIWRRVDCTWQVAGPGSRSKAPAKTNLHSKKVVVTVSSSAANQIHHGFLNPRKQLHLRCVLRKPRRYTRNCSAHSWPVAWGAMLQKLNESGYEVLSLLQPPGLSQTDQTSSSIKKTLLQLTRCRKCLPEIHWLQKHEFLCNGNKLISRCQKYIDWTVMVSILTNKDVLTMIWNS